MNNISPLASVSPAAKIGDNVTIGPFAVVESDVVIGDGCYIMPHAIVMSYTTLGKDCTVFPGAVVGAVPQDLKFHGEISRVEIGDRVMIRECATINRGTEASGKFCTKIGNDTLIMSYVHIAHDCEVGNHCILVSKTAIAGETKIEDWAVLGGGAMVHQFSKIGAHAMVGGASKVTKDVPPYILVDRDPICYMGVNRTGLLRRGFTEEKVNEIKDIYETIYLSSYNVSQALEIIQETMPATPERDHILSFIRGSKRGVVPKPRLSR